MSEGFAISEAFAAVMDYAEAHGAAPLNAHEGCWESRVDGSWRIALNGHEEPKEESTGFEVKPFCCYVEFNGWPAGDLSPFGGIIAAGEAANEDTFIEALRAQTEQA